MVAALRAPAIQSHRRAGAGGADRYADALASVVPLRIGGGSRRKILEALAAGMPVVSTQLGAEGLALRDREHAIITRTVQEIGAALLDLDADPALGRASARPAGRSAWCRQYYTAE